MQHTLDEKLENSSISGTGSAILYLLGLKSTFSQIIYCTIYPFLAYSGVSDVVEFQKCVACDLALEKNGTSEESEKIP